MQATRATEAMLPALYGELRRLASRQLSGERAGHTLQPTALVHEAWLRLVRGTPPPAHDRGHLLALCARAMRQVLVDHAVRRGALKRGGDRRRVPLDDAVALYESRCTDLVALDRALERLHVAQPALAELVDLRFFGGLTVLEAATALGRAPRTVERQWATARAWLRREVEA